MSRRNLRIESPQRVEPRREPRHPRPVAFGDAAEHRGASFERDLHQLVGRRIRTRPDGDEAAPRPGDRAVFQPRVSDYGAHGNANKTCSRPRAPCGRQCEAMKLGTGEVVDPRRQGAWSPCGYPSRPSTVLDRVRPNGLDPPLVGSAFGQVLDEHQTRHRARRHRRPTLDTPLPGIARGVRASRPGEIDPRCLGRGRGRSEPSRNTGRRQPDGRRYPRGPARVGNPLSACRLHPPFISSAAHQTRHGQRGGGAGRNGARHDRGLARDPPLPDVAGRVRSRLPGEVGSSCDGAGCGYGELGRRARSR